MPLAQAGKADRCGSQVRIPGQKCHAKELRSSAICPRDGGICFLSLRGAKERKVFMKKSTKIFLLVLVLVLVVGALVGAWLAFSPDTAQGSKSIRIEVTHLDGSEKEFSLQTDEEFLAPVLLEEGIISGTVEDYGLFIDTVDGEYADAGKNQWWVFTVNGEMGMYGADTQPIADGDSFEFSIYES